MCSYGRKHLEIDDESDDPHGKIIQVLKVEYDPIRWHQKADAHEERLRNDELLCHNDEEDFLNSCCPRSPPYDELLCQNCWIELIPHLPELLAFIKKYLFEHCRCKEDSKIYIESLKGYVYSKFIFFIICQSLTIRFILSHFELYSLLFDICMRLFHVLYIDNDFGVYVRNLENERLDEEQRKRNTVMIKIYDFEESKEGTVPSREILEDFNRSFVSTSYYWKQHHFQYLMNRWKISEFVRVRVIDKLESRCPKIDFRGRESWNGPDGVQTKLVIMLKWMRLLQSHQPIDFRDSENDSVFRKILGIAFYEMCYIEYPLRVRTYWNRALKTMPIDQILQHEVIKTVLSVPVMKNLVNEMKRLLGKQKKLKDRRLLKRYAEQFNGERTCCDNECTKRKWEIDHEHRRKCEQKLKEMREKEPHCIEDNFWDRLNRPISKAERRLYETRYIKHKFYRCSGCDVAVYCSRICQKRHWNYGGHKAQCRAIHETSDLLL